jgi:hypothetical protein
MNIIKEWWRDNVDALIGTALTMLAMLIISIALIVPTFLAIQSAFPDDNEAEAVSCECKCNNP